MKYMLILSLACILALLPGCSSHMAAQGPSHNAKRIVDLVIHENSTSLILTIKGNRSLTYTAGISEAPKGILIQFADTGLELNRNRFQPPGNEFISAIRTGETDANDGTTSNIFIGLKKETPYDLVPVENGLQVVFNKTASLANDIRPRTETVGSTPQSNAVPQSVPFATRLQSISVESHEAMAVVNIKADGTIKNFRDFTMDNPARIVFDLQNLKCSHDDEQKIAVRSQWVKQIRYFGHPDKLRLVIETSKKYLSNYSSLPTDTGLLIQVGQIPANAKWATSALSPAKPGPN